MLKRKKVRERGKIKFSEYLKQLKQGDRISVKRELAVRSSFPKRLQGKSGIVEEKRGRAYVVKIKDLNKEKRFIIQTVHLKKLR